MKTSAFMTLKTINQTILGSLCLTVLLISTGCTAFNAPRSSYPAPVEPLAQQASFEADQTAGPGFVPTELNKVTLAEYRIEPPDVLSVTVVRAIPKPPHKVEPLDGLLVGISGLGAELEIRNAFPVDPEGKVDLGPSLGRVSVTGLTVDEAAEAIRKHLATLYANPVVSASLAYTSATQPIQGQHLVGLDGRINLGTFGSIYVTGLTIQEARKAIEKKLSETLVDPEVDLDIFAYNSKRYYVITQGVGSDDSVNPLPLTGNETVLRAISQIGGISQVSSSRIWIARPSPGKNGCAQRLEVDWKAITQDGIVDTNYQIFAGDRIYIAVDPLIKVNAMIGKVTAPFERVLGFVGLGTATLNRISRFGLGTTQ